MLWSEGFKCVKGSSLKYRKGTQWTNLLFPHQNLLHERFLQTDLGQLYLSIPFAQLASTLPPPKHTKSGKGCKPWFNLKGGIAMQFFKYYLCMSDALLIERINTDWSICNIFVVSI